MCNFCFIFIILLYVFPFNSQKQILRQFTHAHARTYPRTRQYTNTTHTLSDGTPRRSRTRARTHRFGATVYTRTMTVSGAVDDLPVPAGGVGRGRSRERALAHIHTHTRAAIAPARGIDIVSWVALTSVRAARNAARDWSGPPRSVQRLTEASANRRKRYVQHRRDDNLTNNA